MRSARSHQLGREGKSVSILFVGIDLAKSVVAVHRVNNLGKPEFVRPRSP